MQRYEELTNEEIRRIEKHTAEVIHTKQTGIMRKYEKLADKTRKEKSKELRESSEIKQTIAKLNKQIVETSKVLKRHKGELHEKDTTSRNDKANAIKYMCAIGYDYGTETVKQAKEREYRQLDAKRKVFKEAIIFRDKPKVLRAIKALE